MGSLCLASLGLSSTSTGCPPWIFQCREPYCMVLSDGKLSRNAVLGFLSIGPAVGVPLPASCPASACWLPTALHCLLAAFVCASLACTVARQACCFSMRSSWPARTRRWCSCVTRPCWTKRPRCCRRAWMPTIQPWAVYTSSELARAVAAAAGAQKVCTLCSAAGPGGRARLGAGIRVASCAHSTAATATATFPDTHLLLEFVKNICCPI